MRTAAFSRHRALWGQALYVLAAVGLVVVFWRYIGTAVADPSGNSAVESTRTTAQINLRAAPDVESEVLRLLPAGAEVLLVGLGENGFVPVVHERQLGWLFAAYVGPTGVTTVAGVEIARTEARVNLRIGPSAMADSRGVVPGDTLIAVLGEPDNGFVPVSIDGRSGFVATEYLVWCDANGGC